MKSPDCNGTGMMTPEQEKKVALEDGLIEPVPVRKCDPRVHIDGCEPKADMRLISEGQYLAMLEVWLGAGHRVLIGSRLYPDAPERPPVDLDAFVDYLEKLMLSGPQL